MLLILPFCGASVYIYELPIAWLEVAYHQIKI
jgi:hypothetical protein